MLLCRGPAGGLPCRERSAGSRGWWKWKWRCRWPGALGESHFLTLPFSLFFSLSPYPSFFLILSTSTFHSFSVTSFTFFSLNLFPHFSALFPLSLLVSVELCFIISPVSKANALTRFSLIHISSCRLASSDREIIVSPPCSAG